jgi:cystathionine beta-lyase/cystathionine gamma-synthase
MYTSQSVADYKQDFEELHSLLEDCVGRLKKFLTDIHKAKKYIAPETHEELRQIATTYIEACHKHNNIVQNQHASLRSISEPKELEYVEKIKRASYEFLRVHQGLIGALITASDWQSPTFLHTLHGQAGRQTNSIYPTINDYKRDQHWDAYTYEQAFLKNNIDAFIKFPIHLYATSSGMAALTTITQFLLLEKKATRPVIMGKSTYFENKELIRHMFPHIIEVDEHKTDAITQAIHIHDPSVIFLDSLTNTQDIATPNLEAIASYLIQHTKKETFLVIDNTSMSVMFQPFGMFFGKRTNLRLILFESLNKYHQFGFDRTTGGMITAMGGNTGKLSEYRGRLGTNISDISAASLPSPNRKILTKRLLRHTRNAMILASELQKWIERNPKSAFTTINYPGLPDHPAHAWTKQNAFHGSYFTIQFKKNYQTIPSYKRFVRMIWETAKRYHVDLSSGTSFGLHSTRIYLTAIRSKPVSPFVRIAVGTETRQHVETIIQVFLNVCSRFH